MMRLSLIALCLALSAPAAMAQAVTYADRSNVTTSAALLSNATGTLTDTGALTLTVTGQDNTAATANAIDCRFFMVEFIPAVS